ncbi:MAG TPA: hypothetical protein VLI92_01200 [Candidatus Saccharimonadales bacterium]|nr:hypothetical protein [Candidatus Saccharimonadales bacterium]
MKKQAPTTPRQIDISGNWPLLDTFGHRETEIAAYGVLKFLQEKKRSWKGAFTKMEAMQNVYKGSLGSFDEGFDELKRRVLIEVLPNNRFRVTQKFIDICYKYHPVKS